MVVGETWVSGLGPHGLMGELEGPGGSQTPGFAWGTLVLTSATPPEVV